ncbi:5087_t:CDS:2 [Paraglomus occultum]|uniref:5087_t:CDS:1 n=1 Tax=Paraglomus occultum TaxID=144539 RepID=A0A9N9A7S9_9GLOM|nr:5087_t:CDS:2 [Paraglomus occultum]
MRRFLQPILRIKGIADLMGRWFKPIEPIKLIAPPPPPSTLPMLKEEERKKPEFKTYQMLHLPQFKNFLLREIALTHPRRENPVFFIYHDDPELLPFIQNGLSFKKLAFLGDGILNVEVSRALLIRHPHLSTGDITIMRQSLVSRDALGVFAEIYGIPRLLIAPQIKEFSNSIYAEAMESVIAALDIDSGRKGVRKIVEEMIDYSEYIEFGRVIIQALKWLPLEKMADTDWLKSETEKGEEKGEEEKGDEKGEEKIDEKGDGKLDEKGDGKIEEKGDEKGDEKSDGKGDDSLNYYYSSLHYNVLICMFNIQMLRSSRKIAIAVKNYSQDTLEKPRVWYINGTSKFGLPFDSVVSGKGLAWGARKTEYSTAGTAGVITYKIRGRNLSLAVMWSVPFWYVGYANRWNVKVYEGTKKPQDLFYEMYNDGSHRGNSNHYEEKLFGNYSYRGTMGDAGQAILTVDFKGDESYNSKHG